MEEKKIKKEILKSEIEKVEQTLVGYCAIEGMSRREDQVVAKIKERLANTIFSHFERDGMGNLYVMPNVKDLQSKAKVIVSAHIDEVGYIVKNINDKGFLEIMAVGGIWPPVAIDTICHVYNNKNEKIFGIIGHTSIHILESDKFWKVPKTTELFVDVGCSSKKEVLGLGINIGSPVYLDSKTLKIGDKNLFSTRAIDNRAGVTAIDLFAQKFSNFYLVNQQKVEVFPILVFTVQEEVGSRGAKVLINYLIAKNFNPEKVFVVDTCPSYDTPGCVKGIPKLGNGVALEVMDGAIIVDPKLVSLAEKVAKTTEIPHYFFTSQGQGGNDSEELQYVYGGTSTITYGIPQRYLHASQGLVSLEDIYHVSELLQKTLEHLNQK